MVAILVGFMCLLFNVKGGDFFGGVNKLTPAEHEEVMRVCGTGFNPNEPLLLNQEEAVEPARTVPTPPWNAQLNESYDDDPVFKIQSDHTVPTDSKRPWVAMLLKTDRKLSNREFNDWLHPELPGKKDIKFNVERVCGATLISYRHVVTTNECFIDQIYSVKPTVNCLIFIGSPVYQHFPAVGDIDQNGLQSMTRHLYMLKDWSFNFFTTFEASPVIIELDRPVDIDLQTEGCARPICLADDFKTWSFVSRPIGTIRPVYLENYEHQTVPSNTDSDFIKYAAYKPSLMETEGDFFAHIPGFFDTLFDTFLRLNANVTSVDIGAGYSYFVENTQRFYLAGMHRGPVKPGGVIRAANMVATLGFYKPTMRPAVQTEGRKFLHDKVGL